MKNELFIGNFKFSVDQNIIFCTIYNGFDENSNWGEIDGIFLDAVTTLSKGKLLPLFIDLSKIDHSLSIKFFKFISNNFTLKKIVLSKTFLVNTYKLKIVLFVYNFTYNLIIPNAIFKNHNLAIKNCIKNHKKFKRLSFTRTIV